MKALSELGISPWPWKADEEGWVDDVNGVQVITNAGALRDIKKNPDACLIAAAPELYEALRGCYITMEWLANHPDKTVSRIAIKHFDNVKAALAKASGEEAK